MLLVRLNDLLVLSSSSEPILVLSSLRALNRRFALLKVGKVQFSERSVGTDDVSVQ